MLQGPQPRLFLVFVGSVSLLACSSAATRQEGPAAAMAALRDPPPSESPKVLPKAPRLPKGPCPVPGEEIITIDEAGYSSVECPSVKSEPPVIEAGPWCVLKQDGKGHLRISCVGGPGKS